MEAKAAITALDALAQESRLTIFRHLVQIGPEGCAADEISDPTGGRRPWLRHFYQECCPTSTAKASCLPCYREIQWRLDANDKASF